MPELGVTGAGLATAIALVLSIGLCALLRRPFRGRGLIDALLTLPLVLPPTVLGYYLLTLLSRRSPLGQLIESVFGAPLTFTRAGAVVAATVQAAPLCYRGLRAALDEVDPLLLRAARCLGASEARVLWTVTLPLARRGVAAACALALVATLPGARLDRESRSGSAVADRCADPPTQPPR